MTSVGRILIASVVAPHKVDGTEASWLTHAEAMQASHPAEVDWFLAAETDARGLDVYGPMLTRFRDLGGIVWIYTLDKAPHGISPYTVTSADRLIRICTGRNLAIAYALDRDYTHVLWLDTDVEPPPDVLPKLLEVDRALVYGHVPSYDLSGPWLPGLPGDCRAHWSSAGFAFVSRDVLRRVRWGYDPDAGIGYTDDRTYARDVEQVGRALGRDWAPVTRHDTLGRHHPEVLIPLEQRGTDRRLYR